MQYDVGQRAGLTGTPMILAADGTQLGGYMPPAQLRAALDKLAAEPAKPAAGGPRPAVPRSAVPDPAAIPTGAPARPRQHTAASGRRRRIGRRPGCRRRQPGSATMAGPSTTVHRT